METIKMLVESDEGHSTFDVPADKIVEETVKQVEKGNWATLRKDDGTSEMITKADLEEEDDEEDTDKEDEEEEELDAADKEIANDWKNKFTAKPAPLQTPAKTVRTSTAVIAKKFEKVTSVTCMSKSKGG